MILIWLLFNSGLYKYLEMVLVVPHIFLKFSYCLKALAYEFRKLTLVHGTVCWCIEFRESRSFSHYCHSPLVVSLSGLLMPRCTCVLYKTQAHRSTAEYPECLYAQHSWQLIDKLHLLLPQLLDWNFQHFQPLTINLTKIGLHKHL